MINVYVIWFADHLFPIYLFIKNQLCFCIQIYFGTEFLLSFVSVCLRVKDTYWMFSIYYKFAIKNR